MDSHDCAPHEHILEMFQIMRQFTSLNPHVLETYTTAYSLIECRQFTDMIELANHIIFLAQMQTQVDLAGQVQSVVESWVLWGDPMPNQFIYETTELFNSIVSASNRRSLEDVAKPVDVFLSGFRIQQGYTSFTPWAMNSYRGSFHDSNMPQQQQQQGHFPSVYRADTKVDFNCLGRPSCNFCTKVRRDMLKHEAQH
jgi:hypothetical protein